MIFDEVRRQCEGWYTAHPADSWDTETWESMAEEAGATVEELRQHLYSPHVEMTCPLCGQPQTHLISCKGCGSDAWGWQWSLEHGEDFADHLRQHLQQSLMEADGIEQVQAQHAVTHTYRMGGCTLCPACWRDASLEWGAHLTCPLYLVSEREDTGQPGVYLGLMMHLIATEALGNPDRERAAAETWINSVWDQWVKNAHLQWISAQQAQLAGIGPGGEVWAVAPQIEDDEAVGEWRGALIRAAATAGPFPL